MIEAPLASPLAVAVLSVSDTRTLETDTSGACAAERLAAAGHVVRSRRVVKDEIAAIQAELRGYIDDRECQVVVITGGTGVTARDVTPEAIEPLITKPIPGFGELFRMLSFAEIGAATIQSRACAGVCGGTLVFALPGSTAAVRLALDRIIVPQLDSRTTPCNFARLLPRL